MTNSENNHHAKEGTADLPQSPPGAPEGHDAAPGGPGEPLISAREPEAAGDGAAPELPDPAAFTPAELQSLLALADKADEYLALAQRKQAEFENYRKRAARETTVAQERGATKLAKELLPAVDNLERALQHAPDDGDDHGFVAGVKHVHADLIAALQRAGIEQFSPQGEQFDPTLHEAIAQTPIEGADPGTVVEVYQRGYKVGETVVRPARVVVAG
ncbi:MAG TPA: nucleotide exchange factor GrpE [Solirubrobacteraceae bacterium]|nr:nucleotide exchange factor GrpE [Solirubrobacteraceae bacterium]